MNNRQYPDNWKEIMAEVAHRSQGRCECEGECGLHTTTGRCIELNGEPAKFARGKVVLTGAHMCQDSTCDNVDHIKHLCNRCHLRYDVEQHVRNARRTRRGKKAIAELFE